MKKSKLIAVVASLVVMAMSTASLTASAEDMEVTYTTGSTYTLSIPASITIDENGNTTDDNLIGVSNINVDETSQELNIKVSANEVILTRQNDTEDAEKKIKSDITITSSANPINSFSGDTLTSSTVIGIYTGYSANPITNQSITFGAVQDADGDGIINAGTYKGTLTFTAELVDKSIVTSSAE